MRCRGERAEAGGDLREGNTGAYGHGRDCEGKPCAEGASPGHSGEQAEIKNTIAEEEVTLT